MSNPATNSSTRPMINTMEDGRMRIVYRAKISEKYKTWLTIAGISSPCSCLLCKKESVYQSTYIQVLENHIEWNYPGPIPNAACYDICHCIVPDRIGGVFLDKAVASHAGRAGICKPIPEMMFCPTCFDMCGEGVTLYKKGIPFLCRPYIILNFIEDADALCEQIKAAKKLREGGGNTEAPAPVQMSELPK